MSDKLLMFLGQRFSKINDKWVQQDKYDPLKILLYESPDNGRWSAVLEIDGNLFAREYAETFLELSEKMQKITLQGIVRSLESLIKGKNTQKMEGPAASITLLNHKLSLIESESYYSLWEADTESWDLAVYYYYGRQKWKAHLTPKELKHMEIRVPEGSVAHSDTLEELEAEVQVVLNKLDFALVDFYRPT